MATVSIIIENAGRHRVKVAALFHAQFRIGLGALLKAMDANEPLLERELFPRDDQTFAERLLGALDELDRAQVVYSVLWRVSGPTLNSWHKITSEFVRNQIKAHEMTKEEAQRQVDLEVGDADD